MCIYTVMCNEWEKAIKDLPNIDKELSKYPGKMIKKMNIRKKFQLPVNRSVIVWGLLAEKGFIDLPRHIQVPNQIKSTTSESLDKEPLP